MPPTQKSRSTQGSAVMQHKARLFLHHLEVFAGDFKVFADDFKVFADSTDPQIQLMMWTHVVNSSGYTKNFSVISASGLET